MTAQGLDRAQHWTSTPMAERPARISSTSQQHVSKPRAQLQNEENLNQEVHHRIGNCLQLIASILALDARKARSEEARQLLNDAHRRILAVAAVERQLSRNSGDCELADFLNRLCENLTVSIVGDPTRIAIHVEADVGIVPSSFATNIGLVITELVINAIKHAFVDEMITGKIFVSYRSHGASWKLVVSDDGIGGRHAGDTTSVGLGASIVEALVRQLDARKEILTSSHGRLVSITHIDESSNTNARLALSSTRT